MTSTGPRRRSRPTDRPSTSSPRCGKWKRVSGSRPSLSKATNGGSSSSRARWPPSPSTRTTHWRSQTPRSWSPAPRSAATSGTRTGPATSWSSESSGEGRSARVRAPRLGELQDPPVLRDALEELPAHPVGSARGPREDAFARPADRGHRLHALPAGPQRLGQRETGQRVTQAPPPERFQRLHRSPRHRQRLARGAASDQDARQDRAALHLAEPRVALALAPARFPLGLVQASAERERRGDLRAEDRRHERNEL